MAFLRRRRAEKPQVDLDRLPRHVAIIMDGNGRWAKSRGLPRKAGHAAGPAKDAQNSAIAIAAKWAVLLAEKTGADLSGCACIANLFPTAFGEGLDMHWEEPIAGGLTVNAGVISAGEGQLHLLIDIRYPIDRTGADIKAALEKAIAPYGATLTVGECMEPYYIDPADPKLAVPVQVVVAAVLVTFVVVRYVVFVAEPTVVHAEEEEAWDEVSLTDVPEGEDLVGYPREVAAEAERLLAEKEAARA